MYNGNAITSGVEPADSPQIRPGFLFRGALDPGPAEKYVGL